MIINCKECGHKISDNAESCPICGNIIKNKKVKSVSTKPIIVLLLLLLLSVITLGSYLLLNNLGFFTLPQKNIEHNFESDGKFEVGKEVDLFPYDVNKLSFRSGDESICVCTKVMPIANGLYELSFTAPMLSNSTAEGTYATTVSYTVKVGDVILFVNYKNTWPSMVAIEVVHLDPNKCWYKLKTI